MPSPSEMSRADHEEYEACIRFAYDTRYGKTPREANLRRARQLADELGLPQPGPINGLSAEEATQRATGSTFLPFDHKSLTLSRGQRMILLDALLYMGRNAPKQTLDPALTEERRLLIEMMTPRTTK